MSDKTTIRIVKTDYTPVLTLKDGEYLRAVYADGIKGEIRQVRYIDETHFMLGFRCYHIGEFAELMEANDFTIEKVVPDLDNQA